MKALKDQNNNMINKEGVKDKITVDNNDIREKIKKLIEKSNYNLRDLSRHLKKNDAYLQQYLYRGTPKILPEEYRLILAETLDVDVHELIPNWLKGLFSKDQFIVFKNIEKNVGGINQISFPKELLFEIDFFNKEHLYYYQTLTSYGHIITIVDVSVKNFVKPDIYLLNDKKNYFLATIELSKFNQDKLSVKPYFNNFSPFQINSNFLNISGRILWQCSKKFQSV